MKHIYLRSVHTADAEATSQKISQMMSLPLSTTGTLTSCSVLVAASTQYISEYKQAFGWNLKVKKLIGVNWLLKNTTTQLPGADFLNENKTILDMVLKQDRVSCLYNNTELGGEFTGGGLRLLYEHVWAARRCK